MTNKDELRALAVAAPSGPWEYDPNSDSYSGSISNATGFLIEGEFYGGHTVAKYIAAMSPDVVLALLDEIDALKAELAAMREQKPVAYVSHAEINEIVWYANDNGVDRGSDLYAAPGAKQ